MAVQFHRLAATELRSAVAWYRERDAALADRFLTGVNAAVERIEHDPDSLPIERRHFRRCRVQRFPYRLIFERHDDGTILIVALAHNRRRPGYWRRRT
ncbi:MAG TPA: type II toxin-antitoxin system RelE/ParE family toxin [Planctomycetaceae bacterium]